MTEFTDKIDKLVADLELVYATLEKRAWKTMDSAPTDGTIVNVMGRYKDAERGFPRYAGFYQGEWCEFSRHLPEPLVCWAWRPRDPYEKWPVEVAS